MNNNFSESGKRIFSLVFTFANWPQSRESFYVLDFLILKCVFLGTKYTFAQFFDA